MLSRAGAFSDARGILNWYFPNEVRCVVFVIIHWCEWNVIGHALGRGGTDMYLSGSGGLLIPSGWRCLSFKRRWGDRRRSHVPPTLNHSLTTAPGVTFHCPTAFSPRCPPLLRGGSTMVSRPSTVTLCPASHWSHCPSSGRCSYACRPVFQSGRWRFHCGLSLTHFRVHTLLLLLSFCVTFSFSLSWTSSQLTVL